jgi:translation initiation factor 3 subunit A
LELSESKVSSAQAQAEKISIDNIEDLEASETPESLMLSTVSGEDSRDRTDREVVTPWLKFLWETYRTVLEILRNNANFEQLYQVTACLNFLFATFSRSRFSLRITNITNDYRAPPSARSSSA